MVDSPIGWEETQRKHNQINITRNPGTLRRENDGGEKTVFCGEEIGTAGTTGTLDAGLWTLDGMLGFGRRFFAGGNKKKGEKAYYG